MKNRYTGQDEEPDERLMRSIEEKIDIAENRKDDFRREIMNFIGALAVDGKKFEWNTNDRLRRALELKLFEDQKDSIKLKTLVSAVVDKDTQEKIDIIKSRLIKNFGYNEVSARPTCSTTSRDLRARRREGLSRRASPHRPLTASSKLQLSSNEIIAHPTPQSSGLRGPIVHLHRQDAGLTGSFVQPHLQDDRLTGSFAGQ